MGSSRGSLVHVTKESKSKQDWSPDRLGGMCVTSFLLAVFVCLWAVREEGS